MYTLTNTANDTNLLHVSLPAYVHQEDDDDVLCTRSQTQATMCCGMYTLMTMCHVHVDKHRRQCVMYTLTNTDDNVLRYVTMWHVHVHKHRQQCVMYTLTNTGDSVLRYVHANDNVACTR